jgi:cytochrome P450
MMGFAGETEGGQMTGQARSAVRWSVLHAIPMAAVRSAARRGDLQSRIVLAGRDGSDVRGVIEEIRAAGPLVRGATGYVTADHAVVREVLTGADFRTGNPVGRLDILRRIADATRPERAEPLEPPSLLVSEPPEHTRYRKLVTRVFTVRAVERLRARTEQIAADLLDTLSASARDGRPVDLIARYCSQLPVTVIAEILGVPPEDRPRILDLGTRGSPVLDFGLGWREYRAVSTAVNEFDTWLTRHIASLRADPGDDLLSQLIRARDEEGALNELELKATAGLILVAGFETTVNLLGNGIRLLCDHPAQLARLRAEPGLWANAVDEVLRTDPPVLLTGRATDAGAKLADRELEPGSFVTAILAGANRDPRVFPDPDVFDVARENAREHLSFSAGRHHCLGASLARMEGEVGLRAIFGRYPDLRLRQGSRRRPTRILRGWETLPATLA